ncbi:MAG TPA: 2,3-bisphosphoglycerate-independent phosphoglycerate mutase [Candidatus Pacebacteria bacterium]|nr:MAG: 2,3-bisphosphoglycerate-independent phosphoglycerate mutase [Microgenomates group bacterium GW2011_GWB1_45_17]KKU23907.1 MAG: 2,3-bisphosphoglycerate-independent phosphoglycerate mutase [Microgenomates group bacterium GW2011_GWA1_46_15]KKU24700.1 MAG: 2,3-bisphosphoglycerate-independent phosphoglycerate mutase [Microgenomates group bacterium GW2011_GWC1_46_15]HAV15155.1 2,3-bisphosphoglycerate-independent phosphoglycerate mutase [Candidatus Paceibacterota bacterium]HCR11133.1 2,3-bispho
MNQDISQQNSAQPTVSVAAIPPAISNVVSAAVPKPVVLLILDGWGIGPDNPGNAILRANTPNMKSYWENYPHAQLEASGAAVGLPKGEDGNTETGHLNIGAGRIVYQDLPRINMSVGDGSFSQNAAFIQAFDHVKKNNSALHLMGLVGSGGVHSTLSHLYALLAAAKQHGITDRIFIHAFTDGRDSPPMSGTDYIRQLLDHIKTLGVGKLATVIGRYFAMDRDHRWERTEVAYNALVTGATTCTQNIEEEMKKSYAAGKTDEFIEPISICDENGKPYTVQDNDAVIFFNYRIDRPRQLTKAFVLPDFERGTGREGFDPYSVKYTKSHLQQASETKPFTRKKVLHNLLFITMTEYERGLPTLVAFAPEYVANPLGKVLSEHNIHQLRMAETEKERFVTYYFNGQREDAFTGEEHLIVPSQKVATYDLMPEMSANEITRVLLEKISSGSCDVMIVNYANADMVAHTGNLQATVKACEVTDACVGQIVSAVTQAGGIVLITGDHGNAEELINNETGEVDTEHSIYPVPLLVIGKQFEHAEKKELGKGILADIAPTLLHLLHIPQPPEMTGRALI